VAEGAGEGAGGVGERRRLPIGAFQHLPAVSPAREILATALRRARMVRPSKGIVNASKRERNRGAKQIDTLTKELASPLGVYVRGFPRPQRLHPYEQAVLNLTLGEGGTKRPWAAWTASARGSWTWGRAAPPSSTRYP